MFLLHLLYVRDGTAPVQGATTSDDGEARALVGNPGKSMVFNCYRKGRAYHNMGYTVYMMSILLIVIMALGTYSVFGYLDP